MSKDELARSCGISRSTLYYESKQETKDWRTKTLIETALREHQSYGHKRLAIHLGINKKRVLRVMKKYGIKPYRRVAAKPHKKERRPDFVFPNLLLTEYPQYPGHIYASDFTHVKWKGRWVYVATVLDLFTRETVGFSVSLRHDRMLVVQAYLSALARYGRPLIIHSDQGSEYTSADYVSLVHSTGTQISMSAAGCPWENGYQESFYGKYKVDLGDPTRFETLGELVHALYQTIHTYNTSRIHTALKQAPRAFARQYATLKVSEEVS
jgi:putative transposase